MWLKQANWLYWRRHLLLSVITMSISDVNDVTSLVSNENSTGKTDLKIYLALIQKPVTAHIY